MTDDLYYRKLESTSTTDLVDMIREKNKKIAELEAQNEKMKCCKEEILTAIKNGIDCEWVKAHNGVAKYIYTQTIIDIINENWEIKEND